MIQDSKDVVFDVPKSLPYQKPFIQDNYNLICIQGGFGTGKTESIVKKGVKLSIQQPLRVGMFGVSFERHVQDVTLERVKRYYPEEYISFNKHSIEFCDSVWQLYGLGKLGATSSFASEELDLILVDEFTLIPIDNLKFLLTRQRQKDKINRMFLCGVAPDLGSPHDRFLKEVGFKIYNWSTYDNTLIDPNYIERLEMLYPEGPLRDKFMRGLTVSSEYQMFGYANIQYASNPQIKKIAAYIDPAISEKGDRFVIAVQGYDSSGNRYNLECVKKFGVHINEQKRLAKEIQERWQPNIYGMESNAYQLAGVQILREAIPNLQAIPSTKDKITRALAYSGAWGNNKIFWCFSDKDCINEHLAFPNSAHDDIVDAFAGCYNLLAVNQEKSKIINRGYTNPLTK